MDEQKDHKNVERQPETSPETHDVFVEYEAAFEGGAIPVKYKELMGVAVALATQCPYCTRTRFRKARQAGATERELSEAATVAAAVRRGAAVKHRWARPQ